MLITGGKFMKKYYNNLHNFFMAVRLSSFKVLSYVLLLYSVYLCYCFTIGYINLKGDFNILGSNTGYSQIDTTADTNNINFIIIQEKYPLVAK